MGQVSISKINGDIKESLITCLNNIGGLPHYVKPGDRVLLKPNINGTEAITNIAIIEALIILLKDIGIDQIVIAESTFGDARMTDHCFSKTGYSDLAYRNNIPLINLNRSRRVKIEVSDPLVLDEVYIASEIIDADVIINIPVMKVHYATGVTLSLKNLKGFLVNDDKRIFHEIGLDKAIVDLNNSIGPSLNIIDCTQCMERMGPRGGDIVTMNLLLAGCNRGEVDYIGTQIMGFLLNEVKHLQYFFSRNNMKVENINVVGEKLEDVRRPFKKARVDEMVPESFSIHAINACSSCMNAFLLSCQFLDHTDQIKAEVFMGDKPLPPRNGENLTIAFGNCCIKVNNNVDETVAGCPPYPFTLRNIIAKRIQGT